MMPSKKSSEKPSKSRSRSRSRSRGRTERSSSRTRRTSRSRASDASTESKTANPKPTVTKKSSSRSSKKSTTSKDSQDGEVRETTVVNAVSTRLESEKTTASNEPKKTVSQTETVTSQKTKTTIIESNEAPSRVSMRLREKRGEVEHSDLKAIPMDSKSAKTKKFILAGPWLPVILMLAIPLLSLYLSLMCKKRSCVPSLVSFPNRLASYWDTKTFLIYIGWISFQALLCLIPFGRVSKGLVSKSGTRLDYRCNGFIGFIITLALVIGLMAARLRWNQVPSLIYVLEHFVALQTSAIIVALVTGIVVYVSSRLHARERDLNPFGNSGNCLYDAAVGHELHPRLLRGLDLKLFTLTRVSLTTTAMLALLFVIKDFENRGGIGKSSVNVPLALIVVQQLIYVADSLFFEDASLTSFAMQREGFGLIHCFSRLVWMPFITTMPARYVTYLSPTELPKWPSYAYASIVMLHLVAFVIRRGAISQKSDFRREPNHPAFSSLEIIHSSSKGLLAGGWWGLVRHPNYLGELLMYIAWTLPIGLKMTTPWLCLLLLLLTLVVRMRMVENYCAQRHGSAWKSYCEKVRSRLVPFLL